MSKQKKEMFTFKGTVAGGLFPEPFMTPPK
jgi:hypothetical protein